MIHEVCHLIILINCKIHILVSNITDDAVLTKLSNGKSAMLVECGYKDELKPR